MLLLSHNIYIYIYIIYFVNMSDFPIYFHSPFSTCISIFIFIVLTSLYLICQDVKLTVIYFIYAFISLRRGSFGCYGCLYCQDMFTPHLSTYLIPFNACVITIQGHGMPRKSMSKSILVVENFLTCLLTHWHQKVKRY